MSDSRVQNSAPQSYMFAAKPEPLPPQGKYRKAGPPSNLSKSREQESKILTYVGNRLEPLDDEEIANEKEIVPYFYVDKAVFEVSKISLQQNISQWIKG